MSCVVGLKDVCGDIYLGGDSAAVMGDQTVVRADEKVFRVRGFLIGFCGSYRVGNIIHYKFAPPPVKEPLDHYMATSFVDALRDCLRLNGALSVENGVEEIPEASALALALRGRLFSVESDFQVATYQDDFIAIGAGRAEAYPALHMARYFAKSVCGSDIVEGVLRSVEAYNPKVRGPFAIKKL